MNKEEYLLKKEKELKNILDRNTELRNYINQIFAKKIKANFKEQYNEVYLWRYALYLSSKGCLLLERDPENHVGAESLKTAAEIYENLYYISKKYDKEYSLVLSSLCYDLSGYQANAQCLIDKLVDSGEYYSLYKNDSDALLKYENKVLKTIQLFLQKKIFLLSREINDTQFNNSEIYSFYNDFFHNYINSIDSLCKFILSGQNEEFLEKINESYEDILNTGNILLSHIIKLFKTRLMLFKNRNVWDVLGYEINTSHPIWNKYLKLLTMDIYKTNGIKSENERTSIFEFWKSQLNAIKYGILSTNKNYIIQMPTSAGKTFIAEIMITNSLVDNPSSKCIYIAPFRALTTEIEENLSNRLGKLGFIVSKASGSYEVDEYQLFWIENADVLIATPEKIDLLYRLKPEFFENISLIVTDEGHIIGNIDERSSLLELLIIKLRKKLKNTLFLFISAVMSEKDAQEFSNWLSGESNNVISSPNIYGKEWEPTRKLIGMFSWYKVEKSGQIIYPYEKLEDGESLFLPNIIKQKEYKWINPDTNRLNTEKFPNKSNRAETALEIAHKFIDDGNVLIFTSKPKWTITIGNAFLKLIKSRKLASENIKPNFKFRNNLESVEMAKKWLGNDHTVTKCLRYGVGIHYGPLSEPVRKAIENDFREKKLEILISTNTIGQGLNFPIKTVIIHSLEIDSRNNKRISIRDFWNIVGRAGRAGKETEGQIIFLNFNKKDQRLFWKYTQKTNIEPVKSIIYRLFCLLMDNRLTLEDFNNDLEILVEPSLLNILIEEAVDTIDEDFIEDIMNYSLFKIQLSNENYDLDKLIKSITNIGKKFYSKIEDKYLREIYSKTGFHLSSCIKTSDFIEKNINLLKEIIEMDDYQKLLEYMMILFPDITEMNDKKLDNSVLKENHEKLKIFVNEWISGSNIEELNKFWDNAFSENKDLKGSLQVYINQFLEYRYPWGATVFLLILVYHLKVFDNMPHEIKELPTNIKNIPSFIKYGLNEPIACMSKGLGISTRESCLELINFYSGQDDFEEFITWFTNINLNDIKDMNISEYEIRNILLTVQNLNFKNWSSNIPENLKCLVYGIYYEKDRIKLSKQIKTGDILQLERDLNNPYDIYSIKIMHGKTQLGFVPRNIAKMLAIEMDLNYKKFQAEVIYKNEIYNIPDILVEIYEVYTMID